MNQVIQIIISISVLSIPIVFFWVYITSIKKRTNRIIEEYSDSSSEIFSDLNVWFRNFDGFNKRNKFDLDPFQTLYSFNNCDLILNDKNFIVLGQTKILGKNKPLTPTIFEFGKNGTEIRPGHVKIENIQEVGS